MPSIHIFIYYLYLFPCQQLGKNAVTELTLACESNVNVLSWELYFYFNFPKYLLHCVQKWSQAS